MNWKISISMYILGRNNSNSYVRGNTMYMKFRCPIGGYKNGCGFKPFLYFFKGVLPRFGSNVLLPLL
jgi:hypothetical protein